MAIKRTKETEIFWDYRNTLSYNAMFNFIVGNRGGGKSYGVKEWCIEDFIKDGKQFVYVRRFSTEFKNIKTYWSDIQDQYPKHKFYIKGRNFYIDDKIAGYGLSLTTASKEKSTAFPKVNKIIFDEFLIDKGGFVRYLKDEVELFLNLVETVFRQRDGRIIFLGNAISITNPYFAFFDIVMPTNTKKIYHKKGVLIQLVQDAGYIAMKKKTRMYQILEGTKFTKFAVDNEFLRDTGQFVIKSPQKLLYRCTIRSEGVHYGVWYAEEDGYLYVSQKFDLTNGLVYTTRVDEHTPNTILLKGSGKSVMIKDLIENYKMGLVRFDCVNTQNVVIDAVKNSF